MRQTRHSIIIPVFLCVQGSIWLLFLYLDLYRMGAGSVPLKYCSIVLCAALSLYGAAKGGEVLTAAALTLTLAADTFLLLLNRWYILGVLLFCGVQGLYFQKIVLKNGGRSLWLPRLILSLGALVLLARLDLFDPLNALSLIYFSTFLCNTLQSFTLKGPRSRLFSLGLTLFLCCDLCVGAFNQPGLVPPALFAAAQVGMWLFYLPGQVLITLSGLPQFFFRGDLL